MKRSPIVLAIVQLRFPAILSIQTDEKLIARYQDRIRNRYPYFFSGQQLGFVVGAEGVVQQPAPARNWQFKDTEQNWTVTVSTDAITLESRRYTDIDEFASRMSEVVLAAQNIFEIEMQQRMGLRYINEIRHPEVREPSDWRGFITSALLGPLSDDAIAGNVGSTVQELRLTLSAGSLIVRHGATQGTTVPPEPGTPVPEGNFYLLDLDAFDESNKRLDTLTLEKSMRAYNETIYSLFRWGLEDQLFEYLRGTEDE